MYQQCHKPGGALPIMDYKGMPCPKGVPILQMYGESAGGMGKGFISG